MPLIFRNNIGSKKKGFFIGNFALLDRIEMVAARPLGEIVYLFMNL